MEVRYGELGNVHGWPAKQAGWAIMPAYVTLAGDSFQLDWSLETQLDTRSAPAALQAPLREGFDAAWVRARIPIVFGYEPEFADVEKALLSEGFVAVEGDVAYPFVCSDYYGRAGLYFSDEGPEAALRGRIAEAFWSSLLQEPDELADFEQRVYHPGASIWLEYGCHAGHLYCDESEE